VFIWYVRMKAILSRLRRQHRRVMHQSFHPAAAMRFRPHELKAVHGLLRGMLEEPDKLMGHLRQYVPGYRPLIEILTLF
jgi:hypothetical protein